MIKPTELNYFQSDWHHRWTSSQAEAELYNFKFMETGWYQQNGDTMLVLEDGMYEGKQHYAFYVWNGVDMATVRARFAAVMELPIILIQLGKV